MMSQKRQRTWLAVTTATACALSGLIVGIAPAGAANAPRADLTITPNPWYQGAEFQGWGTSLVWFANATGNYPEELREQLYQAVFGHDGLDLNIARYNIGGGNASDVTDYLRAGGAVEGWWQPDPDGSDGVYDGVSTAYEDRDTLQKAWDANDESHYNWNADESQRWWVERLAKDDRITHWETFANSAPYFMTHSGYVSGGFNSTDEQLDPASEADFARYLKLVTEHLENEYGIDVESIDPFNEPNTNYWGTSLRDGKPVGGRQEGMHVGAEQQADVVDALRAELDKSDTTTNAIISAMDETNPSIFRKDWAAYGPEQRDAVGRMNVHTYGTADRLAVRDLAKQAEKPLWMSEIEGSWVNGWDPQNMANGLGMAGRVMDDIRELEPDAWVLWQPVEDLYNMQPQGENLNWGSMFIDLDCQPYNEDGIEVWKSARRVADAGGDSTKAPECTVETNSKFNAMRNFTKFIHEGDHIIATDDTNALTAVKGDGSGANLVYRNTATDDVTVTIDLSGFESIVDGAMATPYVTTEAPTDDPTATGIVPGAPVAIDAASKSVTLTFPAQSVVTVDLNGISGVSAETIGMKDGVTYQLIGEQSGKALTATENGATITSAATTAEAGPAQAWAVTEVATDDPGTRVATIRNVAGGYLAATAAGTEIRDVDAESAVADPETRWFVQTTDGVSFSLVNVALAQSLDVSGQSTKEDAMVGTYGSNGGGNQTWAVRELTPAENQTIAVRTDAGVPAVLPETVVARYEWGSGAAASVAWDVPAHEAWDNEGRVDVTGTATDVFGTSFEVIAQVDVGGLSVTDPVSVTVAEGSSVATVEALAPSTVPARVGASENTFDSAVVWDFSDLTDADLADPGIVTVSGSADGLDAVLSVGSDVGTGDSSN